MYRVQRSELHSRGMHVYIKEQFGNYKYSSAVGLSYDIVNTGLCRLMALTAGPHQAVLFTLVAAVLGFAAADHFRGAIVEWKPVDPVNFDGRVSM